MIFKFVEPWDRDEVEEVMPVVLVTILAEIAVYIAAYGFIVVLTHYHQIKMIYIVIESKEQSH